MKITVLNGSPKGQYSVTIQYVHYIEKKFPQHDLKIINISQRINKIEKDENVFNEIIDEVKSSDGVVWSFPVYYDIVPSQYKRFIELIWEKEAQEAFKNKYAATLSTSAHFSDHTAHMYLTGICGDLDMIFVDHYSAETDDLLKEVERNRLIGFADYYFESIEKKYPTSAQAVPLTYRSFEYIPGKVEKKIDIGDKKILLVTDSDEKESNLGRMIERFRNLFTGGIEVVNINDIDIKGGCMGCAHCWYDNICVYNDGYSEFFKSKIIPADILIFAGEIKDRYVSAKLTQFLERSFFNHHKPIFAGKQWGRIFSGPVNQLPHMPDIINIDAECSGANNAGIISDEYGDSAMLDTVIQNFAERLVRLSDRKYIRPLSFLGYGATKIVRDLIWKIRFILPDDHKYYKENGLYDFPYKDLKAIAIILFITPLIKIPAFRKGLTKNMKTIMIKPYQKIINSG